MGVNSMKVEIVQTSNITAFVGVRASGNMSELGESIKDAFDELVRRQHEINTLRTQK
jgi:hypothetical protein